MPRTIDQYDVFIATPSGLEDVREAFRDEILEFNQRAGRPRRILFHPVGWEDTLGSYRRPQSLINSELKECDRFILVLWDRWGSPPDTVGSYTSGCHEEFDLALKCLKDPDLPMEDIVVFFRGVKPKQLADPGPQLKQVLDFKRGLEASKALLLMVFDQVDEFRRDLRRLLDLWLYQAESGEKPTSSIGVVPESDTQGISERADLNEADRLAGEGKLTDAEAIFARAIVSGNDPEVLNRYSLFLKKLGRFSFAELMYEKIAELANGLGQEWEEALKTAEQLGIRERMAEDFSKLGTIFHARGDIERSEEMFRKAAEIYLQLGLLGDLTTQLNKIKKIYEESDDSQTRRERLLALESDLHAVECLAREATS